MGVPAGPTVVGGKNKLDSGSSEAYTSYDPEFDAFPALTLSVTDGEEKTTEATGTDDTFVGEGEDIATGPMNALAPIPEGKTFSPQADPERRAGETTLTALLRNSKRLKQQHKDSSDALDEANAKLEEHKNDLLKEAHAQRDMLLDNLKRSNAEIKDIETQYGNVSGLEVSGAGVDRVNGFYKRMECNAPAPAGTRRAGSGDAPTPGKSKSQRTVKMIEKKDGKARPPAGRGTSKWTNPTLTRRLPRCTGSCFMNLLMSGYWRILSRPSAAPRLTVPHRQADLRSTTITVSTA